MLKGTLAEMGKQKKLLSELEVARLWRELARFTMQRDELKNDGLFLEGVTVGYDRVEIMRRHYSVNLVCTIF